MTDDDMFKMLSKAEEMSLENWRVYRALYNAEIGKLADRIEELEAALKWISEYNDDIPAEPPTEIGEESKKLWVALIICTCRAKYALKEKKDD